MRNIFKIYHISHTFEKNPHISQRAWHFPHLYQVVIERARHQGHIFGLVHAGEVNAIGDAVVFSVVHRAAVFAHVVYVEPVVHGGHGQDHMRLKRNHKYVFLSMFL